LLPSLTQGSAFPGIFIQGFSHSSPQLDPATLASISFGTVDIS
jgi:hypothetical protein